MNNQHASHTAIIQLTALDCKLRVLFPGRRDSSRGKSSIWSSNTIPSRFVPLRLHVTNQDVDCSVWRPLIGPNDDWPLAVCDYTTIDVENDIISADRLHHNRVCENQLLFANEKHRWYYVKNQQPHNLLVFRNTDSSGQRASESKTC